MLFVKKNVAGSSKQDFPACSKTVLIALRQTPFDLVPSASLVMNSRRIKWAKNRFWVLPVAVRTWNKNKLCFAFRI